MVDPDRALCRRAQDGCRDAFHELVVRHQRGVLNLLRRRLGNAADAEDAAQDVFVRAWRGIGGYSPRWSFTTWLYAIAARTSVDHLRAARPARAAGSDAGHEAVADTAPGPYAELSHREEARALWRLADRVLPEDQRIALWLRYAEERATGDIAAVLGRTPLAVRLLLLRARRALAARVDPGLLPDGADARDRRAPRHDLRRIPR